MDYADRIKSLETRPAGNIVIRETLTTTDPITGVSTTIGKLPDGSVGFQPFIGDIVPPPVATTPVVTAQPGMFTVSWDGLFVNNEEKPRDFEHVNVIGHKIENGSAVLSLEVGVIRLAYETVFVTTDVAAIGETWEFSLESEDFNGNTAVRSSRSATFTMLSVVTDEGVNAALEEINGQVISAQSAAASAQEAADTAQGAADDAAQAAIDAAQLAGSKGVIYTQSTAPSGDYSGLWIDTAHNNVPRRYLGIRKALFINAGAGTNVQTRLSAKGWAVSAVTIVPAFEEAVKYDLVAMDAGYAGLGTNHATLAAKLYERGVSLYTSGNDTTSLAPMFTGYGTRGTPKNSIDSTTNSVGITYTSYSDSDLNFYLTGVNSAAVITGTSLVAGVNQPINMVMEHPTNFSRWAHIETYATPAAIIDAHLDWVSNNWVAIQDQGVISAASAAASAQLKADQAFNYADTAAKAAGNAQDAADGKNTNWTQPDQPAGTGHKVGDTWFDSDDNYKLRTWDGNTWVTAQDSWRAQQTADSKALIYTQTTVPPVEARVSTTVWYDTSAGLDKIVQKYWNGTAWVALADKTATDARTVADSKGETIYSSTEPTVAQRLAQNTWIDTAGGLNLQKRWNGTSWVVVVDSRIPATATAVTAAQATADSKALIYTQSTVPPVEARVPSTIWNDTSLGLDKIVVKYWNGSQWTATADKTATEAAALAATKTKTYFQPAQPSNTGNTDGDLWFDTDDLNRPYVWNGSAWTLAQDATVNKSIFGTFPTDIDQTAPNKWLYTRYNKTTSANTIPSYLDIVGIAGTSSLVSDSAQLVVNVGEQYIGQLRTIVYVASNASIPVTATHDDGAQVYVDGVSIYTSPVYTSNAKFTLTLSAGWHVIDYLWAEQAGGDGFSNVTPLLSTQVGSMFAPVSLTATSQAVSAAQKSADTAMAAQSYSTNASFDDWTGTYPAGYTFWSSTPIKETAIIRRAPNALRFNVADASVQAGVAYSSIVSHAPNLEYFTVEMDFYLVSGTLDGAGMILDWGGLTPNRAQINLASEVTSPATGKWYRVVKTLRRPTGATGTFTTMNGYLMAQWSGHGTGAAKNIIFDWFNIRPSSVEEILAFNSSTVAQAKADTAQSAAISAAQATTMLATAYSKNPSFDEWASTLPDTYSAFGAITPTKDTTNKRIGAHGLKFTVPGTEDAGVNFINNISHMPNVEHVTIELEFMLSSGTLPGAGILIDWNGLAPIRSVVKLSDHVTTPVTGKWYRVSAVLARPANATGTWTSMGGWLMANWSELGTKTAKTITYDWLNVRPSTAEEVTAFKAPAKYTELSNATAAKGEVIWSTTAPAVEKRLTQNLWVDTTGGLNLHKRWDAGSSSWIVVTDSRIAQSASDITTLKSQVTSVSAQADRSITTFYGTTTPVDPQEGDLWLSGVAGTPMKRYTSGGTWDVFEDPNVQAAYQRAGDAEAAADAKVRTFAQDGEPTGMVPNDVGDLWIDTNDKNRLYRYSGATWVELRDATIADAQADIDRVAASTRSYINNGTSIDGIVLINGIMPTVVDSASAMGGKALSKSGTGNGWWADRNAKQAFDPTALYRLTVRVRVVTPSSTGGGVIYTGVQGYAADGTTYVNASGANSTSSQHYLFAETMTPTNGEWKDFVGYFKGNATDSSSGGNTPLDPRKLHANVRHFEPIVILDYSGGNGVWEISHISLDIIDSAGHQALIDAKSASDSANGKNKIHYSTSPASGTVDSTDGNRPYVEGDTWFQRDSANLTKIIGQWEFTGGAWVTRKITGMVLTELDAGTITVGYLKGENLSATAINGKTITGATIQTEVTAARGIKLTNSELAGYDTLGNKNFSLSSAGDITVKGTIKSGSFIEGATITGTTGIQTTTEANRGIKMTNTEFAGYDANGVKNFQLTTGGTLAIKGDITAGSTITGATVTGSTIQTEITAARGIKLTSTELAGYDTAGVKNFSLTSAGVLSLKGSIESGSTIKGATLAAGTGGIETSTSANRGVKLKDTGIQAYDASGNLTFKVDAATGLLEVPGLAANSIKGDMIASKTIDVSKLTVQDFSNYVENPGFETGNLTGWDVVGGWYVNNAAPHSGTYKALTQYTGATQSLTNKAEVTLPVGGKVRVKFRLYAEAPTSGTQVAVALYNVADGVLESVTNISLTGSWVEIDRELTAATAGAKRLQISTNGTGTGYVRLDSIVVNRMMNGELIVDGAIDGKTITGAIIQSEQTTNRGIKLTSAELAGYDAAGVKNFSLSSAGLLAIRGSIEAGSSIKGATLSAAGGGIETTTAASRGVKLKDTGIWAYDSAGNMTFKVDAATGLVEAPGIKANSIKGDVIEAGSLQADKLLISSSSNAIVDPAFQITEITTGRMSRSTGTWAEVAGTATVPKHLSHTTTTTNDLFLPAPFVASSTTKALGIPVVAGQKWLLEVESETSVSAGIRWNAHRWHADGTFTYVALSPFNTATGKRKVSYVYEIPAGVVAFYPSLACNVSGAVWKVYGNLYLGQQAGTTLIADGAITTNHITVGTLDGAVISANTLKGSQIIGKSITVDKLVVSSSDNLVVGADMSNEAASWTTANGAVYFATGGRSSTPSLRFTGATAAAAGGAYSFNTPNRFTVSSDARFRGTVTVRSTSALAAGKVTLLLRCYTTAATTPFTDVLVATSPALVANAYTTFDGYSAALPADTLTAEVYVVVQNPATGTVTDIDFVTVTRAADGKLVVDGAIDGKTITGALIRTGSSNNRVQLDSLGLTAYNSSGTETVRISALDGTLSATGSLSAIGVAKDWLTNTDVTVKAVLGNKLARNTWVGYDYLQSGIYFEREGLTQETIDMPRLVVSYADTITANSSSTAVNPAGNLNIMNSSSFAAAPYAASLGAKKYDKTINSDGNEGVEGVLSSGSIEASTDTVVARVEDGSTNYYGNYLVAVGGTNTDGTGSFPNIGQGIELSYRPGGGDPDQSNAYIKVNKGEVGFDVYAKSGPDVSRIYNLGNTLNINSPVLTFNGVRHTDSVGIVLGKTVNQTIAAANTWVDLTMETQVYIHGFTHSTTTNAHVVTVQRKGIYTFSYKVAPNTNTGAVGGALKVNGTTRVDTIQRIGNNSGGFEKCALSQEILLNVGDTVTLQLQHALAGYVADAGNTNLSLLLKIPL